ncbi:hypothetical protein [Streptomyces daghestanicus]|uniref:Uncharacterized protein n=1 Tax=Streptomyces daghestanicus TaxID=66885 RepID=A0ABQ3Q7G0_9ACTN|nr:hypothetical protein [Streptomyces daghestanicus]GGU66454.1 hypothetical protein GCM10010259_65920 [Streptomyces daghestanicus]GHI33224.1 hypothetical protein Sdagh_49540 [Streptomyces daghestanicus]
MPISTPAATTTATTTFRVDDFVLYRDPVMFWRGEPGHTVVCRVTNAERYSSGKTRYTLVPVTGGLIRNAMGDYMRLLPPLDAMRDIDTAPLNAADAGDGMTAAAMAWLAQQHTTANRSPELPPH